MKRIFTVILAFTLMLTSVLPAFAKTGTSYAPSDAIVNFIANQEGFRAYAYKSGGRSYIGYGTQVSAGAYPNGISREAALEMLRDKVFSYADRLNQFTNEYNIELTQNQFDALLSLTYNSTSKWMSPSSALGALLIKGTYADMQFMNAFGAWCHAGGKILPGLLTRRMREGRIFLYGDYDDAGEGEPDLTYLCFHGGKGEAQDELRFYVKGEIYGEFSGGWRKDFRLQAWAMENGAWLLPTNTADTPKDLYAVWITEEPDYRFLSASPFSDVSVYAWYYESLLSVLDADILSGYECGKFCPGKDISVGAALKMALLAAGYNTENNLLEEYRDRAVDEGFVTEDEVKDLKASASYGFVAGLVAKVLDISACRDGSPFLDSEDPYIATLYYEGIVLGGLQDGIPILRAENSVSRIGMTVIVSRMLDYLDRTQAV